MVLLALVGCAYSTRTDSFSGFQSMASFFSGGSKPTPSAETPKLAATDKIGTLKKTESNLGSENYLFATPEGFETRVAFWVDIYSKYTAEDAVLHDAQNLAVVYKVVDLRPILHSKIHPFAKEAKVKKLIASEKRLLISTLDSLQRKMGKRKLNDSEQELFEKLGRPTSRGRIGDAIANLRMQLGQKTFVEKALMSSDLYLPTMEKIFENKGVPTELTRIPFVESSFNLAARSRVGASGIWQIMPATGRKLMPNTAVDYRNDPIKATEFAASLLKFNYKVTGAWPLAITAYNHGPTSIVRLTKKHNTKSLPELIKKVYGSHAFAFASSNFYACFLAILKVEKNRDLYFPDLPRHQPIAFSTVQLKQSVNYKQLLAWFNKNAAMASQFNPHLASFVRRGAAPIPAGTYLYIPAHFNVLAAKEFPRLARKI
jgi:membrane-bound lytic murein transglycosylase D